MNKAFLRKLTTWSAAIIAIVVGGYLLTSIAPSLFGSLFERAPETGITAPTFSLPDLDGSTVDSSQFYGESIVLLFWTTWNEVSLDELKTLNNLSLNFLRRENASLIAVNSLESEEEVRPVINDLNQQKIVFLLDREGVASEAFNVGTLPHLVAINKNGSIVEELVGPVTQKEIEDVIKKLR